LNPTQQATISTHIIGKDILKFHSVYWPALLMACDLPLPHQNVVHGHWTIVSQKISKSLPQTTAIPIHQTLISKYGVDRYITLLLDKGWVFIG
jgi:methionyl-tRNA synthetase